MRFSNSFLILILASGLSSCGISDNAKKAKDAAEQSRLEIANGRMMTRSGASSVARREAIKGLKQWDSFEMKVTEGSKFVKALEFQTWSGQLYDDVEYLETLRVDGIREFFRAVYELNDGKPVVAADLSPVRITERERANNVLALAIAMHGVHNYQKHITASRKNEQAAVSLYELLKRSLKAIKQVELGNIAYSELRPHQKVVSDYKNEAVAITQARMNMLLTMALTKTTNMKEKTTGIAADKLLSFLYKTSFDFNFLERDMGEQKTANRYMDAAYKVKIFLDEIGEDSGLIEDLQFLYSRVAFPADKEFNQPNFDNPEEEQDYLEYLGKMNEFFDWGSGKFLPKQ